MKAPPDIMPTIRQARINWLVGSMRLNRASGSVPQIAARKTACRSICRAARGDASCGGLRCDRRHERTASEAVAARVRPQIARKSFQPRPQNRISTMATFSIVTAIVTGISCVTASICLARMRPISRSLRPAVRLSSISKPPSQYRNAPIRPSRGSPRFIDLSGHPIQGTFSVSMACGRLMPG